MNLLDRLNLELSEFHRMAINQVTLNKIKIKVHEELSKYLEIDINDIKVTKSGDNVIVKLPEEIYNKLDKSALELIRE